MNLQEFIRDLADVEGKDALAKYVKDFWQQASNEDRAVVIQGIENLGGHLRKVVKSFWELCGIAYTNGWVTIDGKSYAITPTIVSDDERAAKLYKSIYPPVDVFPPLTIGEAAGKLQPRKSYRGHIGGIEVNMPILSIEQQQALSKMSQAETVVYMRQLLAEVNPEEK